MLVANIDVAAGLANGVMGKITSFNPVTNWPIIRCKKPRQLDVKKQEPESDESDESDQDESADDNKTLTIFQTTNEDVHVPPGYQDVEITPYDFKYEDHGQGDDDDSQEQQSSSKKRKRKTTGTPCATYSQLPLKVHSV